MSSEPSVPARHLRGLERSTLRARALASMRASIIDGELSPGVHLSEVELAEQLGISRGTVREALRHLQQEGLVVPDHRGRLSVRTVSAREIAEAFEVRAG